MSTFKKKDPEGKNRILHIKNRGAGSDHQELTMHLTE